MTELKDVHISSAALGKAHVLALTNKGHVYTFGINNKGQCGRDFTPQSKDGASAIEGTHVPDGANCMSLAPAESRVESRLYFL